MLHPKVVSLVVVLQDVVHQNTTEVISSHQLRTRLKYLQRRSIRVLITFLGV